MILFSIFFCYSPPRFLPHAPTKWKGWHPGGIAIAIGPIIADTIAISMPIE